MMSDDEILLVVRAHKEGKKIQQRDRDHRELGWRECPFPNWDFYRVDYRVAPGPRKPREFWLTTDPQYSPVQHSPFPDSIHVREVLE